MSEIDETVERIKSTKGVIGVIVMDWEGRAIKSTLDEEGTAQYIGQLLPLAEKSKATVQELDSNDDLTFIRLRSRKHEIMLVPDKQYLMAVVQVPEQTV